MAALTALIDLALRISDREEPSMQDEAPNEIVIERNLLIELKDGASLSADLYRPAGNGKFPALMSFYPYHKDDMIGASFEVSRRYFAERGYAHLLIDFRGDRKSTRL